uniref:GIY-YIG nuclease family protein n=1 Tax=Lentilactobacillus hilgardii TaxID=1588 RepID=UPI00403F70D6
MPIQAFFIPRNMIRETIKNRQELSWNGVYTLFDSVNANNKTIYIGEAENIGHRLIQHDVDRENWWNIAVAFVVNNERHQLSKADIKFLENIMYNKASQAGIMKIIVETCVQFAFRSPESVQKWEKIYLNQGKGVLLEMHRGVKNNQKTRPAETSEEITKRELILAHTKRCFKKINSLEKASNKEISQVIISLRARYKLADLIEALPISMSVFQYWQKKFKAIDPDEELKQRIKSIYVIS